MRQQSKFNLIKDIYRDQRLPTNNKESEKHKRSTETYSKYTPKYKMKNKGKIDFKQ